MNAPLKLTSTANPFAKWFEVVPVLGISMMDHLFNRLDGAYPHKWRSNFPNQQAIDNWCESWAEAFEEEGITPQDIKSGLRECRKRYDWPPSCAEFIKACRPSLDPVVAYQEAVNGVQARERGDMGKWSHPAIYWASVQIGAYDLKNMSFSQVKTRWEKALQDEMDKGEWTDIPKPLIQLPAPGKSELSRDKAAQMLNELGAAGVLKPCSADKRWARKIMDRLKAKDQSLPSISVQMAKEVLGVKAA